METAVIEQIHHQFKDYYDGACLKGSYRIFAPFYKVSLKIDYIFETQLSFLEQFVCKCISNSITTEGEISYVLGLSPDSVSYIIGQLVSNNYVKLSDQRLEFTNNGAELFKKNIKREGEQSVVHSFYDGLTPEYKIEFFNKEDKHIILKYKHIPEDLKGNVILPQTFPQYDKDRDFYTLSKKMLEHLNSDTNFNEKAASKRVVTIKEFELENSREVFYHEYLILIFERENGTFSLLAYDPCGEELIDQRVTQSLQELYQSNQLDLSFAQNHEATSDIKAIIEALKNTATSNETVLEEDDINETISNLEQIEVRKDTSRYIMNYEIRKLFLHYLKTAQESLYIISPWMNSYIVNDEFIEDITNLLKRGVKVSIIYGINAEDEPGDIRNQKTNSLAEKLKKLGKKHQGLLMITHGQTHEKLLICDRKYYINGSFNFLSYSGEDDGKYFRNEGSTYSEDLGLIEETIKLRFGEVLVG
ncbi:phospholipase D-like domain-containing protein [Bacillus infantis]|uniref:phospholipase D-like domain-containing protein n=1 Tax=Bacillus infantis TaxID=324767 RepID=UPI00344E6B16